MNSERGLPSYIIVFVLLFFCFLKFIVWVYVCVIFKCLFMLKNFAYEQRNFENGKRKKISMLRKKLIVNDSSGGIFPEGT